MMVSAKIQVVCCVLLFALLFQSCDKKGEELEYYSDGQVRLKAELKNSKRDGMVFEFYPNGLLKSRAQWREGKRHGAFAYYYSNGQVEKKGMARNGLTLTVSYFYEEGLLSQLLNFDSVGNIVYGEKYNADGTRWSGGLPIMTLVDSDDDSITVGSETTLRTTIINIVDSMFVDGTLYIASGFDTLNNGQLAIRDTMAIVRPANGVYYQYNFLPTDTGRFDIFGMFVFKQQRGDELQISTDKFVYPYYVKKQECRY